MNQRERVLSMLKAGPVCGTEFLRAYLPRFGARIYELRQQGLLIDTRPCKNEYHAHESPQLVYELAQSDQMALPL